MTLLRNKPLLIAAFALLLGGLAVLVLANPDGEKSGAGKPEAEKQRLGLMTSLPIYWREVGDLGELLSPAGGDVQEHGSEQPHDHGNQIGNRNQHWVRTALEEDYALVPLDSLYQGNDGAVSTELAGLDLLLLAQPHTLVPLDNVALDSWVRDGGTLLMFSDPMLTGHSRFGFGDKRRPQDIGLVPPVFGRWGLSQAFTDGQPEQGEIVSAGDLQIPVIQRGTFALLDVSLDKVGTNGDSCRISGGGLIAECRIGGGRAFLIGDAAILDEQIAAQSENGLKVILRKAFSN